MRRILAFAVLAWVVSMNSALAIGVERVGSGFSAPVFATAPVGDTGRLFVVEQRGAIKILDLATNVTRPTPFLTLGGLAQGFEQGLLGLAFHPDYATNGYFFVYLTEASGTVELRRYRVSASDANVADPASGRIVLRFHHPFANHNGGWIAFGPDGYLYIASGDGGGAEDPRRNGQDTYSLLGKLLRIDVSNPTRQQRYAIPPSNPFPIFGGAREVWAYGLRNPWRCSFDRETGDLWIADVGQGSREEIDFQPAGAAGGCNYGWRIREGSIDNPSVPGRTPRDAVDPIYDYPHGFGADAGNSITGGYVYRGSAIPALQGTYFFADYISGNIWSLHYSGGQVSEYQNRLAELVPAAGDISHVSSFAEDAAGELYVISLNGDIFRIVP
jgi:glucose/arabinose dehydrogenase